MNKLVKLQNISGFFPECRRSTVTLIAITTSLCSGYLSNANASQALVQRNACIACHQSVAKVVGPSWKQVAEKYSDGKMTVEQLAASIKGGSVGKWGSIPMPPQAQVSDADLKTIAQWLLDGAK